ncbi:type VI secretion system lipoprotein TssJ [Cupriavidus basilensis]
MKSPKAFECTLSYAQLQTNDLVALKPDLLAARDVILRPDASVSPEASRCIPRPEYVGVIALLRSPAKEGDWKLVVPKKQWKKTDPVRIEVRGSTLELAGTASDGPDRGG